MWMYDTHDFDFEMTTPACLREREATKRKKQRFLYKSNEKDVRLR